MHSKEELAALLHDTSTVKRRKAAKIIFKEKTSDIGDELYRALLEELKITDPGQWETKVEMINAIGKIDYKKALPVIHTICEQSEEDTVTIIAATAYVRLKREDLTDADPVIELLSYKGFAVPAGALRALGADIMIPSKEKIQKIIELSYDLGKGQHPGTGDAREGLIVACSNWDKEPNVIDFLNHCILTSKSSYVKGLAQKVLEGKKVNINE